MWLRSDPVHDLGVYEDKGWSLMFAIGTASCWFNRNQQNFNNTNVDSLDLFWPN